MSCHGRKPLLEPIRRNCYNSRALISLHSLICRERMCSLSLICPCDISNACVKKFVNMHDASESVGSFFETRSISCVAFLVGDGDHHGEATPLGWFRLRK